MQHYLFVHFKEKNTPDGEQVYFALSADGFHWEKVNNGYPVLYSMLGEKGVRDFTIQRSPDNKFYILATDLCLSYNLGPKYHRSWGEIQTDGSNNLMMWESEDLCHWSPERALPLGPEGSGCHWAPDMIWDRENEDFILTWSGPKPDPDISTYDNGLKMCIWYSRTKDFKEFSDPAIFYEKEDSGVIDSCMAYEDGTYYLFVKSDKFPCGVIMLKSETAVGPWERMPQFDPEMASLEGGSGSYEAPCIYRLEDGRWCLNLDYFGVRGKGQGYVPFMADSLQCGVFKRCDAEVSFPYGFKHGTVLPLTEEEYARVKAFDYEGEQYAR